MAFKITLSLLLAALIISSLTIPIFSTTQAQSIPKPSVPEFTMQYAMHPYDVPPVYGIDQYTGQQVVTSPGYHVENRSVEITIKNQPFTPIMLDKTHQANFYYNVSYRGHYGSDWSYFVPFNDTLRWFTTQSTSDYTVIAFTRLPDDAASFDFRVQAKIGCYEEYHMPFVDYSFTGQLGDWSSTQTIDVPAISQTSPNPTQQTTAPTPITTASPTATANAPGDAQTSQEPWVLYGVIAALGAVVAVLVVVVASLSRKIRVMERRPTA